MPVNEDAYESLSRREREMMEVVYRLGEATAAEVRQGLLDPPSYSAVRTTLKILEEKGRLTHRKEGPRFVYSPTVPPRQARRSALRQVLRTFFAGAPDQAFAALLDVSERDLTPEELDRIAGLIDRARKEGR
jgi:predicted transcriptional regulator